ADNAFLTTFWTTLSALFPAGETFFIDSVKNYRHVVTDQKLKDEISGFIGQEALHTKEHQAFNDMADRHGLPSGRIDKELWGLLDLAKKVFPKKLQLATTVALEHYTAILAEQLLRDTDHQENIQDREALKLWMWHALEENEHKSVAYDVYELIGGGYFTRIFAMIVATIGFIVFVGQGHLRMLWANGTLFDIKDNAKGFWKLLGWKGLFPRLFFKYMDFYRPGFHPNDHDTVKLLEDWRERMLNEGGLLAEQTYSKSKAA
ncbi:MAG: metal-dependent hydrolase, partial [Pseudomonadota bacterium]|nr:metal-dependent hydrolase [Pseudomonadota bacterium]